MASLGSFLLLASFVVCSYAAMISVVGARRGVRRLIESGIGAFYLVCALMTSASAVMLNAFLTGDFTLKYVAHNSDSVQPLFYKITAYWGGLDGSIMFWVFLLSIFGSLAVYVNRERHRELIPYVIATISVVQMFFLYLMVVHKNPFTTYLSAVPADGEGLNPLLQNFYMAIHPPTLYTGFVGMTIPFAFGIAALVTGHLDDSWLRAVRRWTMFAWLFLSFGLFLGMIWAYEELGWGGYWAWDPVLAWLFTGFMVVILTFSFALVIYRLPLLKARNELDSWVSREAAFLVNNWILLFSAFFVLFGTMFPTLSEALTGNRLTVAGPFFNKWMTPIGLVLLFLTGVGPLLAWRKSTLSNLRYQFLWPAAAFVATAAALAALGIRLWASGLCFALCAMVMATILQEFFRGANVRRRNTGTDILTALVGLVGRNKRRYGGYIAHVGFVLILLGFGGGGFNRDTQVELKPGQETKIGRYTLRSTSLKVNDDGQKQMITAAIAVFVDGQQIDTLYPAKWFFRKHENEPTTEVAIRRTLAEDLYITLGGYEAAQQAASLEIHVNPLVN